jgi:hypothetical protein
MESGQPEPLSQPGPHLKVRLGAVLSRTRVGLSRGASPRVGPLRSGLPLMHNKNKLDTISA